MGETTFYQKSVPKRFFLKRKHEAKDLMRSTKGDTNALTMIKRFLIFGPIFSSTSYADNHLREITVDGRKYDVYDESHSYEEALKFCENRDQYLLPLDIGDSVGAHIHL